MKTKTNAPSPTEPQPPTHRCNGVNGAERHGTQNKCTVCGEYRNGWFDSNGMELLKTVVFSPTEPVRCPKCGRKASSDFDPDVGGWYECEPCDYQWTLATEPVSSQEAPERVWLTPQFAEAAHVIGGGIYHVDLSDKDKEGCIEYIRIDLAADSHRVEIQTQDGLVNEEQTSLGLLVETAAETADLQSGLLPCPFCLGPADITSTVGGEEGDGYMWHVFCAEDNDCAMMPERYAESERTARHWWNLRADTRSRVGTAPEVREAIWDEAIRAVQSVYMTVEPLESPDREHYATWQTAVTDVELALEAAKAAAGSSGSEWRPIEEAPKDGRTLLLGYLNQSGRWRTTRGQWFTKEQIDDEWDNGDDFEADWYETSVENDEPPNCWLILPTHWQPLPAPPADSEGGK